MRRAFLATVLAISGALLGRAADAPRMETAPIAVQTHTLKNGLKILIHEDHSIPTVAAYIFYRVGSRNERPGTTGLSHFFEHMMFNGAKKYAPKEFDRVMEAAGGANNALMVVCGDIKPAQILKLATHYLEPINPRATPPPVTTVEPEQPGERRVKVVKFAQLPLMELAYHVPRTSHADFYALQVLQNILFVGQSSRLYLRLVDRDQLALSVEGGMKFAMDPTLFTIFVQPKENVPLDRIETAL